MLADVSSLPGKTAKAKAMYLLEQTGVAAVPGSSTLWAVGNQINNAQTNISQTLILRNTTG